MGLFGNLLSSATSGIGGGLGNLLSPLLGQVGSTVGSAGAQIGGATTEGLGLGQIGQAVTGLLGGANPPPPPPKDNSILMIAGIGLLVVLMIKK